ncbi:MAG: SulP family inorganic anion transporter [Burkholderiales bacterium]|nr:SulP family inorganic anion transporter [Burkholderiales bacterium]
MISKKLLQRFFPFLSWFPVDSIVLRGDLIAGITGALVLVPKAMAYAQLAGLPVYFGLYTAFIPAILGALWGSSRQLATGPVAIVSLMTAAAVAPLAVPMTESFIGLVLLLTFMVGLIQFGLGTLKLGTVVNFVSHPVILGFMNAAAIIIAISMLDKLLGIPKGRSDSFLVDVWEMLGYLPLTHLPTLAMAVFALALMLGLKKVPLLAKTSVLIAVIITTLVSVAVNYEQSAKGQPDLIADSAARELVTSYATTEQRINSLLAEVTAKSTQLRAYEKANNPRAAADLRHDIDLMKLDSASLEKENKQRLHYIRKLQFERAKAADGQPTALYLKGIVPTGIETDGHAWHIKKIEKGEMKLIGGGEVVGTIPQGLPSLRVPTLSFDALMSLFSAAIIISLVAFMESISMAKAMAAKSKQKVDPNQELIGQGLSNLGGAFFQAYPACGSFTGSAINLQAGAKTGFAMVFNGVFVAMTLLFLTPYLYHLPQATLAVIILLAVVGLVNIPALKHTWQASRSDGIVAFTTFSVTLLAAPHLDKGIMVGAILAIVLYLYRTMKPRVSQLGRHKDGTLRDVKVYPDMPTSEHLIAMRFDGSLYFANVSYFEDTVLEAVASKPNAKYLLVVGEGINQLDATGEEMLHHLVERLRETGVVIVFSGLKKQVRDVMQATGLNELIGADNFFPTEDSAIAAVYERLGVEAEDDLFCALPARA